MLFEFSGPQPPSGQAYQFATHNFVYNAYQDQDSAQLAPVMFLYMQHPHASLTTSSHALFCAMVKQCAKVRSLLLAMSHGSALLVRRQTPVPAVHTEA